MCAETRELMTILHTRAIIIMLFGAVQSFLALSLTFLSRQLFSTVVLTGSTSTALVVVLIDIVIAYY